MRGVTGLVAGVAGLLSIAPPVAADWLVPAVAANFAWTAFFALVAWRWGLAVWLVSGEILVTTVLCLLQDRLIPAELLAGGASWVAGLVTMTIVAVSLAWPPFAAVLGGLVVAVAHLVGAQAAGVADGGYTGAGINLVQIGATAVLATLLRGAARAADALLSQLRDFEERATVERERRTDERAQNSRMHGSFLATLMVIGAGGIRATSPMLRETASANLAELERIAQTTEPHTAFVALNERIRLVAARADVKVKEHLSPCAVPWFVADAFAEAVAEALANVHRHARTDTAEVRLTTGDTDVRVEVVDHGTGFDHALVPDHRYGIRVSIVDRLESVGGSATVTSDGQGTRVDLRWSP
ncbi:sensor histidine kinase [Acrocarpospora phusangensis]|nr:ATP-binding protein [Acrocarpospora phusangensis]